MKGEEKDERRSAVKEKDTKRENMEGVRGLGRRNLREGDVRNGGQWTVRGCRNGGVRRVAVTGKEES